MSFEVEMALQEAFHKACGKGDAQMVYNYIQHTDIDVGHRDKSRNHTTALIKAVMQNQVDIVLIMLLSGKLGESAYAQDSQGFNALHWALILGHIDIISIITFLDQRFLTECDKYGRSPVEIYTHIKKQPQVRDLIALEGEVDGTLKMVLGDPIHDEMVSRPSALTGASIST